MPFRVRDSISRYFPRALSEANASRIRELPTTIGSSRALGALALGAIAIGAVAVGAVVIGRLAIGRARIRRLEIDELVVRSLRVTETLQAPPNLDGKSGLDPATSRAKIDRPPAPG